MSLKAFIPILSLLLLAFVPGCNSKSIADGSWGNGSFHIENSDGTYHGNYTVYGSIESGNKPQKKYWNKALIFVEHYETGGERRWKNPVAQVTAKSEHGVFVEMDLEIEGQAIPFPKQTDGVIYFNDVLGNIYEYLPTKNDAVFDCLNNNSSEQNNENIITLWKHLQTKIGDSKKIHAHDGMVH